MCKYAISAICIRRMAGMPYFEFLVHRLMVPDFHSHPCPDASSKYSQQQKRGFRNAPLGFLRLVFVNAVHDEYNCIDGKEIVGEATV